MAASSEVRVRRRGFIGLVTGAISWPLVARAQKLAATPRVVQLAPVDIPGQIDGTRGLLAELGYVEGRNIQLEFRNTAGNADALPALAEEIVREGRADVIIAISTPAALAAYKATRTIPIVALAAVDPVASGLADSLAHPGHNVTGIAVFSEETTVKRVELMREVLPQAVRLGTVTTKLTNGAASLARPFWRRAESWVSRLKRSTSMIPPTSRKSSARKLSPDLTGLFLFRMPYSMRTWPKSLRW